MFEGISSLHIITKTPLALKLDVLYGTKYRLRILFWKEAISEATSSSPVLFRSEILL